MRGYLKRTLTNQRLGLAPSLGAGGSCCVAYLVACLHANPCRMLRTLPTSFRGTVCT
jgi:hypothetical protein